VNRDALPWCSPCETAARWPRSLLGRSRDPILDTASEDFSAPNDAIRATHRTRRLVRDSLLLHIVFVSGDEIDELVTIAWLVCAADFRSGGSLYGSTTNGRRSEARVK
jgi:hypothetical protein